VARGTDAIICLRTRSSAIERDRAQLGLHRRIALGLLVLVLQILLRHPQVALPLHARPDEITGHQSNRRHADRRHQPDRQAQEQFGKADRILEHDIHDLVSVGAQNHRDDAADSQEFEDTFPKFDISLKTEDAAPPADGRDARPLRPDALARDARHILEHRGGETRRHQDHQHGQQKLPHRKGQCHDELLGVLTGGQREVPRLLNEQGELLDEQGAAIPDHEDEDDEDRPDRGEDRRFP